MPRYDYQCLTARQRTGEGVTPFCIFFAPASEILAWSSVDRIRDRGRGFQRIANPSRVRGVGRFFRQESTNTIPTSIILTIKLPEASLPQVLAHPSNQRLSIDLRDGTVEPDKPGLVIDGQHRLEGANAFDPNTLLSVVALLNPTDLETAFQFLVINNKSAKVPPDHIHKLALNYNEEGLEHRLRSARLSLKKNFALVGQVDEEDGSPFKNLIRWPTPIAEARPVVPAAIDVALLYIQDQQLQPLMDDNDALLEFFYTMWSTVRNDWADVWANPSSTLLNKVGVVCLTQYLTDSLAKAYEWGEVDLSDPSQIASRTTALLSNQDRSFWTLGWKEGGLDTIAGRQLVIDDLTRIARNRRGGLNWHEDLVTVKRPESL
jgi:DGQHR domain-containing protein